MTRHLLALATWQPIPYIASDLGIPEQTIRTWIRRDKVKTWRLHGYLLAQRSDVDRMTQARVLAE